MKIEKVLLMFTHLSGPTSELERDLWRKIQSRTFSNQQLFLQAGNFIFILDLKNLEKN